MRCHNVPISDVSAGTQHVSPGLGARAPRILLTYSIGAFLSVNPSPFDEGRVTLHVYERETCFIVVVSLHWVS